MYYQLLLLPLVMLFIHTWYCCQREKRYIGCIIASIFCLGFGASIYFAEIYRIVCPRYRIGSSNCDMAVSGITAALLFYSAAYILFICAISRCRRRDIVGMKRLDRILLAFEISGSALTLAVGIYWLAYFLRMV